MMVMLAIVLGALHFTHAKVESMTWADLNTNKDLKLVLFHDPASDESVAKLATLTKISELSEFTSLGYAFKTCDITAPENHEGKKNNLGGNFFTQTPEDGISSFAEDLTVESLRAFHRFSTNKIDNDNVKSITDMTTLFELVETRPVFLKMFEQWCGHCKRMKKHFQTASNAKSSRNVHFVEVECSATRGGGIFGRVLSLFYTNSEDVCGQLGVKGFPSVRLLAKVDGKYRVYTYKSPRTYAYLAKFASGASELIASTEEYEEYSGFIPERQSNVDSKDARDL